MKKLRVIGVITDNCSAVMITFDYHATSKSLDLIGGDYTFTGDRFIAVRIKCTNL